MQLQERQEEEVEKEDGEGEKEKEEVEEEEKEEEKEEDGSTVDHHLHQWLSHWSGEWEPPPAVGAGPRKGNIPFYTQLAASQMSDFEVRQIVHAAAAVMTSITELKLSSPVVIISSQ